MLVTAYCWFIGNRKEVGDMTSNFSILLQETMGEIAYYVKSVGVQRCHKPNNGYTVEIQNYYYTILHHSVLNSQFSN